MKAPRRSLLVTLPLFAASVAACASTPGSSGDEGHETARVQAFLDGRYLAGDVRHTFRTRAGEVIDCVDFAAQPAVKAMAARGMPAPQPPKLPDELRARATSSGVTSAEAAAARDLDEDGHPRICPDGSVAEVRITAERIRAAGGLDAFEAAVSRPKAPPPTPGHPDNCDFPNYAHVIGAATGAGEQVSEGGSTTSIFAPVTPAGDHSISQTWTYSGYNLCDGITSTVQSVEVGWIVDPVLDSDESSHLFIYSTTDGYMHTGCYNDWSSTGSCVPWVQYSQVYAPGMALPSSVVGGAKHELAVLTSHTGGQWWILVTIDGTSSWLGYYPSSNFHGSMQTYADNFEVGGEVYDATGQFSIPMGSGVTPDRGYGLAAYHHDVWTYDAGKQAIGNTLGPMVTARPASYTESTTATPGSNWGNHFFFGNTVCHPTTCAAQGATCGSIQDGCGDTLQCGTCGTGDACESNSCVCVPPHRCPSGTSWNSSDCACEPICRPGRCQ